MGRYEQPKKPKRAAESGGRRIWPIVLAVILVAGAAVALYLHSPPAQVDDPNYVPSPGIDTNESQQGESNSGGGDTSGDKAEEVKRDRKKNFYTMLLVGTMDNYNTDTIMLVSIDASSNVVNLISIPRDTMVDISESNKKINGAYGREGIEELCREIEGITDIYPDFYCALNVASFVKIVDLFGGVYFNVPYDMYHPDSQSELSIDLKAGPQTLDGKKALQMVRFRGTSQNDFGRMELQRNFLVAIAKKVLSEFSLSQVTDLIPIINESVKTNMSVKDMLWFYTNVVDEIDFDNDVRFHAMPVATTGNYKGLSYVYLDKQGVADLLNETVNPYDVAISPDSLNIIRLQD